MLRVLLCCSIAPSRVLLSVRRCMTLQVLLCCSVARPHVLLYVRRRRMLRNVRLPHPPPFFCIDAEGRKIIPSSVFSARASDDLQLLVEQTEARKFREKLARWNARKGKKRGPKPKFDKYEFDEKVEKICDKKEIYLDKQGSISTHVVDDIIWEENGKYYLLRRTKIPGKLTWETLERVLDGDGPWGINGEAKNGHQLDGVTISTSGHALAMPMNINHGGSGPHAFIIDPYAHKNGE